MSGEEFEEFLLQAYDLYIENVKLATQLFDHAYLHPDEITFNPALFKWDARNVYLQSINDDRLAIGRSILENGMYFPFIINTENQIYEGIHRLWGLQQLPEPSDRKYLSLYMNEDALDRPQDVSPEWDKPQQLYLPFERLLQLKTTEEINNGFACGDFKFTSDIKFVKVFTVNKALFCDYIVQFGCWFRDHIFYYEHQLNKTFKGSDLINK